MENFDVSLELEYRYYQDIAKRMARCCKLGRDIDANEAYYYMHLHYVKSFKDACIACIKDNRRYIVPPDFLRLRCLFDRQNTPHQTR